MALPIVLAVDDDPISGAVIAEVLKDWADVVVLNDGRATRNRALAVAPDLILLDVLMPGTDGYLICAELKADPRTRDIPVIFVSTLADEGEQARGLLAGAVDYVTKPLQPPILSARVRNHIEIKRQRDRLERVSQRDDVTGLPTTARVQDAVALEWQRAANRGQPLSLVTASIDDFEAFGRVCGPLATRECVRRVAGALSHAADQPNDLVGRLGPNGFVLLLPGRDAAEARTVADRARGAVRDLDIPDPSAGPDGTVSVSLGLMTWRPSPGQPEPDLVKDADAYLRRAPLGDRGQVVRRSPSAERTTDVPGTATAATPPPATRAAPAGRLVAIDDDPLSLEVLATLVRGAGYQIDTLGPGDIGANTVARVAALAPDLVLLDVRMPELDGFAVCRRLKADPTTAAIPVVFVSVIDDPAEKLQAFEAGGADYVGKAFHPEEVLARISYQIKITRLQRATEEAHARLVELSRVKATFAAMLVHDLRSPLGVVLITLTLLKEKIQTLLDSELNELVDVSLAGLDNTIALITELLEIYRSEHGDLPAKREPLDLREVLAACSAAGRVEGRSREVAVELRAAQSLPVLGDRKRLERGFANLIGNAVKFAKAGGGHVVIDARPIINGQDRSVRVEVRDDGPGIPEADIPYIFDLYRQAETGQRTTGGVGLGLAIVKNIVDAHGARIAVASQLGIGTAFTIDFPSGS